MVKWWSLVLVLVELRGGGGDGGGDGGGAVWLLDGDASHASRVNPNPRYLQFIVYVNAGTRE